MSEFEKFQGSLKGNGFNLDHGIWNDINYCNIIVEKNIIYNRILFETYMQLFCQKLNLSRKSIKLKVCKKISSEDKESITDGICYQKPLLKKCKILILFKTNFFDMIFTLGHELTHAYFHINNYVINNTNYEEALCECSSFYLNSWNFKNKLIKTHATEIFIHNYMNYRCKRHELISLLPKNKDIFLDETAYKIVPFELFHKIVSFEDAQFCSLKEAFEYIVKYDLH